MSRLAPAPAAPPRPRLLAPRPIAPAAASSSRSAGVRSIQPRPAAVQPRPAGQEQRGAASGKAPAQPATETRAPARPTAPAAPAAPRTAAAPAASAATQTSRASGPSAALVLPPAGASPSRSASPTRANSTSVSLHDEPSGASSSSSASVSSSSSSSSATSPPAAAPPANARPLVASAASAVQPSRAWLLPARAKPGRKPSAEEPPTKRKAQNRASQRAFRERKQSYLAGLEAKVAAYEAAGVEAATELQRVARRMKEENEALRRENAALRRRCETLGQQAAGRCAEGQGCKRPLHEQAAPAATMMSTATSAAGPSVRLPRPARPPQPPAALNMHPHAPPSPPSALALHIDRDCGICTQDTLCLCRGEVLDLTGLPSPEPRPSSPVPAVKQEQLPALRLESLLAPAAPLARRAPSGKARLWNVVPPSPRHTNDGAKRPLWPLHASSPGPRFTLAAGGLAAAAECSGDPSSCGACGADPALAAFCEAVSRGAAQNAAGATYLDAGNAVPLRQRRVQSAKRSVWYTEPPTHPAAPPALPSRSTTTPQQASIPEAWRLLRSHPQFPAFEASSTGGLSLLADVVSGRAPAAMPAPPPPRHRSSNSARSAYQPLRRATDAQRESVEIEPQTPPAPQYSPAGAETPGRKLVALESLQAASAARDAALQPAGASSEEPLSADRAHKRRRLAYVEQTRVEQALALLDGRIARPSVTTPTSEERTGSAACPCPWSRG